MAQQNCQEETKISEYPLRREPTVWSEDLSGKLHDDPGKSQPTETTCGPEVWTKIGKAAQNREKQEWAKEKAKADNARKNEMKFLYRSR